VLTSYTRYLPPAYDYEVLAILFNCCEPEAISLALQTIQRSLTREKLVASQCLLGAYANRLTIVDPDWTLEASDGPQPMRKDLGPDQYCTEFAQKWCQEGNVRLMGGCCGMTPEHIAALKEKLITSPSSVGKE
jgi:S-methylmethionine-dependent homocysteine/selenocysteine methylase